MYYILIYNRSHYESFDAAYQSGGVYQTGYAVPSLDCISGLKDILSLIEVVAMCAENKSDVVAGIYRNNKFIELPVQKEVLCA
ncbi:MAG: hypothetical protein P8I03_02765 [Thalassotalea sp.]|nr:hypothetical protein [Thalassotalea sp.]